MTEHSNSVKMTIEERIAQELKSDRLGACCDRRVSATGSAVQCLKTQTATQGIHE